METFKNKYWDSFNNRFVSIITPTFNRRDELLRAMDSVNRQTYRDFEYVIVNDGSTIDIDDIVFSFMDKVDFPMLYIKKSNGGVHTARNLAIKHVRGKMIAPLDSDDELVNNALEILVNVWNSIPENKRNEYREVCARCKDQDGNVIGNAFPEGINELIRKEAYLISRKSKGEHFGFWRSDIMKDNPWPEPDGITFVSEEVLWEKLAVNYRSYYINDVVRIYHIEENDSYTRNKLSVQQLKNKYWSRIYMANSISNLRFKKRITNVFIACVFKHILIRRKVKVDIKLTRFLDILLLIFFWIPCFFYSFLYENKKMIKNR